MQTHDCVYTELRQWRTGQRSELGKVILYRPACFVSTHCSRNRHCKGSVWCMYVLSTPARVVSALNHLSAASIRLGGEMTASHSAAVSSSVRKDSEIWSFLYIRVPFCCSSGNQAKGLVHCWARALHWSSARLRFWQCSQAWSGPGLAHHKYQTFIFYGWTRLIVCI